MRISFERRYIAVVVLSLLAVAFPLPAQDQPAQDSQAPAAEGAEARNQRLKELWEKSGSRTTGLPGNALTGTGGEYRIGADDLLEISIFEAPELNRTLRVTSAGAFTMPPLGLVKADGLTPRELEFVLQELLRRSYLRDPHVGVFVQEMNSHPVSVIGAVRAPGVYQISGARTLVEVLSMAGGLSDDAGDAVVVMRGGGVAANASAAFSAPSVAPPGAEEDLPELHLENLNPEEQGIVVNLKHLLESGDPRSNLIIYPGDVVKVARAGIVYVVGDVRKAGGFLMKTNENISVLQAVALAQGLNATAAKSRAMIIRTTEGGGREEIPIDLGKLLKGKVQDPYLQANDIVFVPNSTGKTVFLRGLQEAVRTITGVIIFSSR